MSEFYIPVFFDWPETTQALDAESKGRLIDALVLYARGSEEWQDEIVGNERFVFPIFKAQIDRSRTSRETSAEIARVNGKKGGRPRKSREALSENPETQNNPAGFLETQKNPAGFLETRKNHNNNNNDNDNNNEQDNDYETGNPEEEEDINNQVHTGVEAAVAEEWRYDFGQSANPETVRVLARWARRLGYTDAAFIREALSAAALRNANDPVAYAIALFKDWSARGIRSPDELE